MRIMSRLVNTDITIGSMVRQDDHIVIASDSSKSMAVKVYLSPDDIVAVMKAMLSRSILAYVLSFPLLYLRYRRKVQSH